MGELEHRLEHALEVEGAVALADRLVQLRQPVQHPAFEFRHLFGRDPVGLGEIGQRAQHEAHGVAQTPVAVRRAFFRISGPIR